jgi:hypothetical protein
MPRPAAFTPEASSAPARPRKKKGGWFGSKSRASSSSDGDSGAAVGRVSIGGVIAIAIFILRIVAAQAGLFGLSSQSEIESYAQRDLAAANEMTTVLASIRDEPTARAAVPRLTSILDRMIADGHALEGKKGRMTDIDAVKQKYEAQQEAAWQRAGDEVQRVGTVPGGADTIRSVQGKFQELAAIIRKANPEDGNAPFRPTF